MPVEDAEDTVQDFLMSFIERGCFAAASEKRGRMRNFLLRSFQNHMRKEYRRKQSAKRGGKHEHLDIDWEEAEKIFQSEGSLSLTPEQEYDRKWAHTLLARAEERVRLHYTRSGKEKIFRALRPYLMEQGGHYCEALGRELGLKPNAVKAATFRLRKHFRKSVVDEIADTVDSEVAGQAELEDLRDILSSNVPLS